MALVPTIGEPLRLTRSVFEPRLRAFVGREPVVDTESAVLVGTPGKAVSDLAVPLSDVRADALRPSAGSFGTGAGKPSGAQDLFDLAASGDVRRGAAWTYAADGLRGYVGLRFEAFDLILEEDREVRIHPRSSLHRVDAVRSSRHIVVRHGGEVIAESTAPVAVFETGLPVRWYLAREDVRLNRLTDVSLRTGCPYKGIASYLAPVDEPTVAVAWCYPEPSDEVAAIRGLIAFFDELVDVEIDGQVSSRPLTQWSYGLRDNLKGGGSGLYQGIDSSADHPQARPACGVSVAVGDVTVVDASPTGVSAAPGGFSFEPSLRRVRAVVGETAVADSTAPVLVWEPGRRVPGYLFPRDDVRTDLLRPDTARVHLKHEAVARRYDLELDGVRYPGLAFAYDVDGLRDYIGLEWSARGRPGVEHWYEEDEEIFQHPRDPHSRVDPIPSSRHVEVWLDGVKVADTVRPVLVFETGLPVRYYFPGADVDQKLLLPTGLSTTCPYKGNARYWSVDTGVATHENIVWSYREPISAVASIAGLFAFYQERVDLVVDGVSVPRESEPSRIRPKAS